MTQVHDRGNNAVHVADQGLVDREPPPAERPIGVIVNDLWEKAEALVRQEMQLGLTAAEEKVAVLKQDLDARVVELKTELITKAIGGAVVFAALLAFVAAITLLLAEAIPAWLAAFIVALVLGGVGVALLKRELTPPEPPSPDDVRPERTTSNVKENVRTMQEATHDSAQ